MKQLLHVFSSVKPPTKAPSTLSKSAMQRSSSANLHVVSMAEYHKEMEAKAQSVGTGDIFLFLPLNYFFCVTPFHLQ